MKIFLATKNPGKISEFKEILSGLSVDLVTCNDLEIPDVEETGSRLLKMQFLKREVLQKLQNYRLLLMIQVLKLIS